MVFVHTVEPQVATWMRRDNDVPVPSLAGYIVAVCPEPRSSHASPQFYVFLLHFHFLWDRILIKGLPGIVSYDIGLT